MRRFATDVLVKRIVSIEADTQDRNVQDPDVLSAAVREIYGEWSGLSPGPKPNDFEDLDATENVEFPAKVFISRFLTEPYEAAYSGKFEAEFILTRDLITTNDLLIIDADDETKAMYLVGEPLRTGITSDTILSFRIDNVAEMGTYVPGEVAIP